MWIEINVAAFPFHLSKFATHPPREIVREVSPPKYTLQTTGISYLVILPVFIVDVLDMFFFFWFFLASPLSHPSF